MFAKNHETTGIFANSGPDDGTRGYRLFPMIFVLILLLSSLSNPCPAEAAADKPTIDTTIEGTLVDVEGKPINEGFVMLQGNPQLNALTCSDGRFRITGEAWEMPDTLLASSAGKEVAQIKIDHPKVNALTIRLQPQDPELTKIEMGMSLKIGWFLNYANYRNRPLTEAQKECIAVYDDFLKNKGAAIIDKMLAGTALADDEKRFEYILASEIWCRTSAGTNGIPPSTADTKREKTYYDGVMKEFYRVSRKALQRQRLTEGDVHALRLMAAMYRGTGFDPTGYRYVQGLGVEVPEAEPGKPLPCDVPLVLSSPLLASPVWSNYTSLSATAHLRLEGLWSYLDSYWKWQILNEKTMVMSPPEEWKQHYWQDWYQVTSVNGLVKKADGRPLLIYCDNFADNTFFGFYTRQAEYFRRAFRGQIDVYLASQTGGTGWVDVWEDEWLHYGPNPKADPLIGLDCPRWEEDNYTPLRHARTDKLSMMDPAYLWASGEILLDQPRFSSYLINNVALEVNVVLDRDGKVALPFNTMDIHAIHSRYFSPVAAMDNYTRQGASYYWEALLHEQMLRILIQNDGRIGPETFDKILVQYPPTFTAKDDLFVVNSIDKDKGIIHAGWIDPGGAEARGDGWGRPNPRLTGTPKGDFLLKVNPDTRYVARYNSAGQKMAPQASGYCLQYDEPPGMEYRLVGLDDFKPGDRFFVTLRLPEPFPDVRLSTLMKRTWDESKDSAVEPDGARKARPGPFDMSKYDGKELLVERVMNYLTLDHYNGIHSNYMPLYGRITRKENNVITVKINREEVKEMHGYQIWKEEEANGRPENEEPTLFWPTLKRWGDGTDEDRTYRFKVDEATDVYRNGLVGTSGDLEVGDYVFVEYETWWETQNMQRELILPERLQASAPIEVMPKPKGMPTL